MVWELHIYLLKEPETYLLITILVLKAKVILKYFDNEIIYISVENSDKREFNALFSLVIITNDRSIYIYDSTFELMFCY